MLTIAAVFFLFLCILLFLLGVETGKLLTTTIESPSPSDLSQTALDSALPKVTTQTSDITKLIPKLSTTKP